MKNLLFFFFILLCFSFSLQSARASTYVDVENDEIYNALSRLEAEGVITDALLSTKPLSRKEVVRLAREAELNSEGRSEFVGSLVQSLKERIHPAEGEGTFKAVDSVYAKYINTNADVRTLTYSRGGNGVFYSFSQKMQAFNADNNGDLYDRGSNYRTGFSTRLEDLGPLSFYLNPEFRASDSAHETVLKKGYGVLGFSWIDVVLGKDSQWWGPGYNGSLLLSDNAEPFTMIKLTSPEPLILPWIFKYLGPFQYAIFATQLDDNDNRVPPNNLWGMRFDFKPFPFVEIGLERTTQLSGSQDLNLWADSVVGTSQHSDTFDGTDQRAGYDVKLTLPFKTQPIQLYMEADGEDNVWGVPSQWAYLFGVYLPRVAGFEKIGLRTEYALTHMYNHPGAIWYTHPNTGGYMYNDMVIGHHMGSDSEDFFAELSYSMPEASTDLFLSYDQETHSISEPVSEVAKEFEITAKRRLAKRVDVSISGGYGWIENPGNAVGPTEKVYEIASEVRYWF